MCAFDTLFRTTIFVTKLHRVHSRKRVVGVATVKIKNYIKDSKALVIEVGKKNHENLSIDKRTEKKQRHVKKYSR